MCGQFGQLSGYKQATEGSQCHPARGGYYTAPCGFMAHCTACPCTSATGTSRRQPNGQVRVMVARSQCMVPFPGFGYCATA